MTSLIYNIRFAGEGETDGWILVDGEFIAVVGHGERPGADTMIDGEGCLAMPGAIDCHVHFREPGLTHKADISGESRASIAGGVTSYLEMPNTKPATTTVALWQEKMDIAADRSAANYAFFIGATNDNIDQLKAADYTRVPGVKLFMGSSTGNMLVDSNPAIESIFREVPAIVAVHAEDQDIINANIERLRAEGAVDADGDTEVWRHSEIRSAEACYASSAKAVRLARATGHRLHLCHITTAKELELLDSAVDGASALIGLRPSPGAAPPEKLITGEVSPHHLMWCADDYAAKGTRIKMNPAVKTATDRAALRAAVLDGRIDIVATDHAPHTLDEKQGGALKAASGAPLVQFALPWMLGNFPETVVQRTMCERPAEIFRIDRRGALCPGYYADIVLVADDNHTVTDNDVQSQCGWTPLEGVTLTRRIDSVYINGHLAYRHGQYHPAPAKALRFISNSEQ